MKTTILCFLAAISGAAVAHAQSDSIREFCSEHEKGIIESIAKIEKKTDKFNLYLDMHGSFEANWRGSSFQDGKFRMNQLRIEANGNINEWLSYRYRQRLNKGDTPGGYYDNVLGSIDYLGVGLRLGKWSFFLGKQCAVYGGIEFDLNPIEIYQYSDQLAFTNNFSSGVRATYNFTPRQQLQFQVLNSYSTSSRDMFGDYEKARMPLLFTLNWNGNFNNFYKTRWSASVMNETKGKHLYYFALGNNFRISDRVSAYFDWMYSIEGVDRKGIITDIVGGTGHTRNTEDVSYMSFVLHANYNFHPHWNVFAKFMYENEGIYKSHPAEYDGADVTLRKGRYRTALGYIAGIEYYPIKNGNLHLFATYIGRDYRYTGRARAFGASDYTTNTLSVGFIWKMPVF